MSDWTVAYIPPQLLLLYIMPRPAKKRAATPKTPGRLLKKRHVFSLQEKKEIIKSINDGESYAAVGRRKSVNESTIRTIYKSKQAITQAFTDVVETNGSTSRLIS